MARDRAWTGGANFSQRGVTDQAATKVVQGIYDAGLAALANHFSDAGSTLTNVDRIVGNAAKLLAARPA